MKTVVKNKKRPRLVTHVKNGSEKTIDNHVVATSKGEQSTKIDERTWEIVHRMKLLWRIISFGYDNAFKFADTNEENFIMEREHRSKEELLQEFYNLDKTLHSTS